MRLAKLMESISCSHPSREHDCIADEVDLLSKLSMIDNAGFSWERMDMVGRTCRADPHSAFSACRQSLLADTGNTSLSQHTSPFTL